MGALQRVGVGLALDPAAERIVERERDDAEDVRERR